METGWNLFNNSSSCVRGQNGNCSNNNAWGIWELGNATRVDWSNLHHSSFNQDTINFPSSSSSAVASAITTSSTTAHQQESAMHALMFTHQGTNPHQSVSSSSPSSSPLFAGGGSCYYPDPHLTCLKLGKRHYFEHVTPLDNRQAAAFSITKRGKPYYEHGGFGVAGGGGLVGPSTSAAVTVAAPTTVPRCQVEGCNVVLVNAKEYHRRHKVCEVHSKAPKVVVLGVEQRFCQQCSRFHAVSEFDDSKRSCRRRLAGHNERRRKSSQDHSAPRNLTQDDKLMAGRYPHLPLNSGSALSLLSSKNDSWMSSADLSARCSAALRELIAENRAAILARQHILDRNWHSRPHPIEDMHELQNRSNSFESCPQQMVIEPHGWENVNAGTHLTLDLKQTPSSAFGYLSVQGKSKEEECSELWGAFKGTRVL